MAGRSALLFLVALGCGGTSTPPPEIPPIDDESMVGGETDGGGEVRAPALPSEGGARVRLGRVAIPEGQRLALPGGPCTEVVVFVEEGNLRTPADEDLPGGTLYRTQRDTGLFATEDARAIVSVNVPAAMVAPAEAGPPAEAAEGDHEEAAETGGDADSEAEVDVNAAAPVCEERVMGDIVADIGSVEVLPNAGGKLNVQIVLDREGGATFGSFAILEAEADLGVPVHTHEGTAEVLFIDSGDGTMILGEGRFDLSPGAVIYVPPDVEHGYEPGSTPLRAYQVYDPPGPEQRFRPSAAEEVTE